MNAKVYRISPSRNPEIFLRDLATRVQVQDGSG
jgi:hypothetical protein